MGEFEHSEQSNKVEIWNRKNIHWVNTSHENKKQALENTSKLFLENINLNS